MPRATIVREAAEDAAGDPRARSGQRMPLAAAAAAVTFVVTAAAASVADVGAPVYRGSLCQHPSSSPVIS
ncbi:MAG TPA: hypothetical protein VFM66_08885 [Agromyces sp.]|nr:hypothetical protein [Agromyces sp.]